jgi:hypothetical protein
MVASFIPAIPAGIILAILTALTSRPVRYFIVISVILLVLSFYTPFTIPDVIMPMIVALNLMHVTAAAAIVAVLIKLGRQP